MKKLLLAALLCSAPARAQEKAAAPSGAELSRVGPMSRPIAREKEDKKGIEALYKAMLEAMKKGDLTAYADLIDFPVTLISDDAGGTFSARSLEREEFVKVMAPFVGSQPKDVKTTHRHAIHLLSDSLASVEEDNGMSMGKVKGAWRSQTLVIQKDGKWRLKVLTEAGWGGATALGGGAAPAPAQPAPAAPAAPPQK